MGYLANETRVSSLTVNGEDYTSSLISWIVSDESAYDNGCLRTNGTLVLGSYAGGPLIEDYDRNNFKRGALVTLDMQSPGGGQYRHPRGYLYVISTSYSVEDETLEVELGCRLTLMALTENIDDLVPLVPVKLDVAQTTFSNCSAAFASAGQYVYQDNTGALQAGTFFDGDSYASVASGEWVSVLGVTALSVSPLAGSETIPDQINLSYQIPIGIVDEDNKDKVDTVTTESYYFLKYPATIFSRGPLPEFPGSGGGGGGGGGGGPSLPPPSGLPPLPEDPGPRPQDDSVDGNGYPDMNDLGAVFTGTPAGSGNTSGCGNYPNAPLGNPYGSY
jgi:hypothetical protein